MSDERPDGDRAEDVSEVLAREMLVLMIKTRSAPIAPILRPAFAARFENCSICDAGLCGVELPYLVFKEIRRDEVIVELAMCANCLDKLEDVYSAQTQRAIDSLFVASDWCDRAAERLRTAEALWPQWLDRCALTGQARADSDSCQVIGLCEDDSMLVSFFPYVIGSEGLRKLEASISRQSQEDWDRFLGEHQGLPPELRHLLHLDAVVR